MILTVRAPRFDRALDGDDTLKLIGCTDAMVWAETFVKLYENGAFDKTGGVDVGLMVSWFANAIGSGQMHP